jgi:hypothetical protein
MWITDRFPQPRPPTRLGATHVSDLGSQLEDLVIHVMRCERWARFDDRLELALVVELARPAGAQPRRVSGGRS